MIKKFLKMILCLVLFAIGFSGLTACNRSSLNEEIRTITVENFNYDDYLATLDECSISKSQESVVIDAVKTFDKSILEGVNNVAYGEINDFELKAEYSIRYEVEKNLIFLDCILTSDNGQAVVDTLIGTTFYTEENEIDAVFLTENGLFYLSELMNMTEVELCGWFSKLVKAVAITACVAAVTVAAVAALPIVLTAVTTTRAVVAIGTTTVGAVIGVSAGSAALLALGSLAVAVGADVIDKQLDLYGDTYGLSSNQIDAKKLAVASTVTAVLATTYKGDKAIFRWSNKTYTALTPRPNKPTELGVSFSYDCSAFESISALLVSSEGLVNSTGILKAINDHGNHVDVRPNGYSIEEWKASRANATTNPHPCTVALYNVCTKVLW